MRHDRNSPRDPRRVEGVEGFEGAATYRPVIERLEAVAEELALRQVEAVRTQIPSYAGIPAGPLLDSARRNVRRVIATLLRDSSLAPGEHHDETTAARERARQGIPADDVLRGYRLVLGVLRDAFIDQATALDLDPAAVIEGTRLLWELADSMTLRLAAVRREVDLESARYDERQRLDFLRGLLFGAVTGPDIDRRGAAYGLVLGHTYYTVRARPGPGATIETLKKAVETGGRRDGLSTFVGVIDGDVAGIVPRRPEVPGETGTIGVGGPTDLHSVEQAFAEASRMLDVAARFRLTGAWGLGDLSLRVAIASEHDLGDLLVRRHLEPLRAEGEFGEIIEESVRAFMANGRRIVDTARRLHIHPNTLRYRLARFEELTGSSLADMATAAEVWWAFEWRSLWRVRR